MGCVSVSDCPANSDCVGTGIAVTAELATQGMPMTLALVNMVFCHMYIP